MAKEIKPPRVVIPPQVRKPLLIAATALAFALGTLILWQAWQGWRVTQVAPELDSFRDRLAQQLTEEVAATRGRFTAAISDAYVLADLEAGERDDAATRVREGWSDLRTIEFHESTLDTAFAGELPTLGFAKLALLSAAKSRNEVMADLVGAGDLSELGLAGPVRGKPEDDEPLAIAYASVPLQAVVGPIAGASIGSGYLELRSGQRVVASSGDGRLRPYTGLTAPVAGTSMQLAVAAPKAESMLRYPLEVQFGVGAVALLLGLALLWKLRHLAPSAEADGPEPTFAETLRQEVVAPVVTTRRASSERQRAVPSSVDRSIFRAYDIRGIVGTTLDEGVARLIGQSVGSLMREKGLQEIVVGRDGRLSGPSLSAALIDGLRRAGCDVIDIGEAPTPLVYFGTYHLNTGCGIAVTGSHNPPDYNGFKIVVGGDTLSGQAIQDLYIRISENRLDDAGGGGLQVTSIAGDYIERISGDIQLERRLKIVVDAGNGVAGGIGPQVLEAIGAEVVPLYCEVDGEFPNHHPDPSEPHNLKDLITFVAKFEADLGIAFDGDGDRLGVVTRQGEIIYPDRLLMLFAQDVLGRNPGASVIYDVKCTGHLAGQILRHGGSPIMWKTGHSLIKAKMKETEAELAGEMSGHFFFRERWFGFDDGIYSAARLLEILAADDRRPEEIFAELPKGASTPELKVAMEEGENYAFIEAFRERARFEGAKIATIDGVRADWPDGWGLVRCSNTTPSLVLRFDADTPEALERVQNLFRAQLLAVNPALTLPF
jgi:phosphomannomutase/phosphoglucomutase